MSQGRGVSAQGFPVALTNQEILAWCVLVQRRLLPWEFETVRMLDALYVSVMARAIMAMMPKGGA
jgi:hypothetical protein